MQQADRVRAGRTSRALLALSPTELQHGHFWLCTCMIQCRLARTSLTIQSFMI
jgi:hypothetical protein